jgi:hypothetical protein
MDDLISKDAGIRALVAAALEGSLTDAGAEELAACSDGLLKMVLLAAAGRISADRRFGAGLGRAECR